MEARQVEVGIDPVLDKLHCDPCVVGWWRFVGQEKAVKIPKSQTTQAGVRGAETEN